MDLDARYAPATLDALLTALRFRPDDDADLRHSAAAVLRDPVGRARLTAAIGLLEQERSFLESADLEGIDPDGRWGRGVLATLALVGSIDVAVARKEHRGLSHAESLAALSDLGQQLWVDRRTFGRFGLHNENWVAMNWAGPFCWFGRLQFGVEHMPVDVPGHARGEAACFMHIPESGPLEPEMVDASFAEMRARMADLFPELSDHALYCESWLLDPVVTQLAGEQSRTAAFANRFTDLVPTRPGARDAVYFVFRRDGDDVDVAALPRRTRLERGLVDRLTTGGTIRVHVGRIKEER